MTIKFPKEFMLDEVLDGNQENILRDTISSTSRWSEHHELVFRHPETGIFYRTYYACGLTEMQDESPWEYDTEVECTEVNEKEVLVKTWVDA